ncbi:MAG: hypothetical protein IJU12_03275 [Clostridia bacterium]|nr:hypothetical protein [Clostridia bacterium]
MGVWLLDHLMLLLSILLLASAFILRPSLAEAPASFLINLLNLTVSRLPLALGAAACLIVAGPDLSSGRVAGLAACLAAFLAQRMGDALPEWALLLLLSGVCAVIGLIGGVLVGQCKWQPLAVTLGIQFLLYGAIMALSDGMAIRYATESLLRTTLLTVDRGRVQLYVPLSLALVVGIGLIWKYSRLGKNMYRVGNDPEAARADGVNVGLTIAAVFALAGALYGYTGLVDVARAGAFTPSLGQGYELDALAAALIGGYTLKSGKGTFSGVIVGTLLLQVITNCLSYMGTSLYVLYAVKGAVVLLALLVNALRERAQRE